MEDELSRSRDHCNEGDPNESETESEESKHDRPQKRKKTSGVWSFNTTPTQTGHTKNVLVVSHTDAGAIEQLKKIESNALPRVLLSLKLQSVCHMLPQESVSNFLVAHKCPTVASLLPLVFACTDQLSTH